MKKLLLFILSALLLFSACAAPAAQPAPADGNVVQIDMAQVTVVKHLSRPP